MPALPSINRQDVAAGGVSGSHHLAPTSTFPCTGGEQGPAAAIGLSTVIGIVMAEVLHDLGADQVRVKWPNDLYLNDRKLAGITVELTGKTGDAAQIVIGAGLNMVMRNVQNDVVNRARPTCRKRGSPSIAIRLPSA